MTRAAVTLVVVVAAILCAASARAQPRDPQGDTCVAAYEDAQPLRNDRKLIDARAKLLICAQPSCPKSVTSECARWLREVDASLPSVVLSARDAASRDLADVRVIVDGAPLVDRLDGKAVAVDPGEHTFRFERAGPPRVTAELKAVIREGEKNRLLGVVLLTGAPPSPPPPPPPAPSPPAAPPSRRPTALAIVIGAVSIAVAGVGAFLYLSARHDVDHLRDTCAPGCDPSEVSAARTKAYGAYAAMGAGLLGLGAATWLLVVSPASASSGDAWMLGVGARF